MNFSTQIVYVLINGLFFVKEWRRNQDSQRKMSLYSSTPFNFLLNFPRFIWLVVLHFIQVAVCGSIHWNAEWNSHTFIVGLQLTIILNVD